MLLLFSPVTASQAQVSLASLLKARKMTVCHLKPVTSVRLMEELRMDVINAALIAMSSTRYMFNHSCFNHFFMDRSKYIKSDFQF